MTTATSNTVERSAAGVRSALAQHAPAECALFEAELRDALTAAAQDLDLGRVDAVVARWYPRAVIVANPLTTEEREQVERAKAGDLAGLRVRSTDGTWATL
jgi:RNase H-fold protein (predicted Holliday junction resolvase)